MLCFAQRSLVIIALSAESFILFSGVVLIRNAIYKNVKIYIKRKWDILKILAKIMWDND